MIKVLNYPSQGLGSDRGAPMQHHGTPQSLGHLRTVSSQNMVDVPTIKCGFHQQKSWENCGSNRYQ